MPTAIQTTPTTPNPRTRQAVLAERRRLSERARQLEAEMQKLIGQGGILSAFEGANLADSASVFSAEDLTKRFEGKHGITADDLKLNPERVNALPNSTEVERNKREALLLRLELHRYAREVAEKQALNLWQQQIVFGSLLEDDAGPGFGGDVGLSADDLRGLSAQTKSLTVFDDGKLSNVRVEIKEGKPVFRVDKDTTPADVLS